jgi:putative transposase
MADKHDESVPFHTLSRVCKPREPAVCHPVAHMEKAHFTEPQAIACKWCGSVDVMKYGLRKGVQNYICHACGRKFTEKDAPYHMQTPTEQIGAALNMFYDGMSVSAIARHLKETHENAVNASTIYRWVLRYTFLAMNTLDSLKPTVSNVWVVDETVIKVGGRNLWFWDIIDEKTRFLLASHLSRTRTTLDAATIMRRAWQKAGKPPKVIISDKLAAYIDGIELVFGAHAHHVQSQGFSEDINTNLIERFHGTIKARTKVLRAFKTKETAEHILDGFLIHYNFFRPHMSLSNKTPAEVARIKAPVTNWTELVKFQKSSMQMTTLRQKNEWGF